ncbi:Beta-xylosidase, GH43 family [Cyclobacterium lianum]|uniref:Beta-xylosidase, GH43 family n=1 Tax=Cyclobacterium lianum TaxID=388280 RepID=A0A1M7PMA2_9BACT|nr:glycoside hydrolase family 43 protein [Cyclobacterium lianum]SHN18312.1 Beta-xylosidase, GH43 family [Cyclobacterium lianum]
MIGSNKILLGNAGSVNVSNLLRAIAVTILVIVFGCSGFSQEATFTNPIRDGADPWVFQKGENYYYCASSAGGIAISRSAKLTDHGTFQKVWDAPDQGWNSANIWAPELHFIDGHWYIYYAAGKKKGGPFIHQKSGVLKSEGEDPFGSYEDMGMLYTGDDITDPESAKWAIDLSPFEHKGQLYAIWSGWEEDSDTDRTPQHLYIARMSDPVTISSNRVKLSSPEEKWETGGELDLNEGPQVLKQKKQTFIIYSTRESWLKDYRLGQLRLKDPEADPMLPENWEKSGPVFSGSAKVHGVGHCSFAKSPDGSEHWILYHSKKTTEPGWDRDIRLQPFHWQEDGSPFFGTPKSAGVPLNVPSGEK